MVDPADSPEPSSSWHARNKFLLIGVALVIGIAIWLVSLNHFVRQENNFHENSAALGYAVPEKKTPVKPLPPSKDELPAPTTEAQPSK